jgi:hypothetical protein
MLNYGDLAELAQDATVLRSCTGVVFFFFFFFSTAVAACIKKWQVDFVGEFLISYLLLLL